MRLLRRHSRSVYAVVTFASLAGALFVSILWGASASEGGRTPWEPIIQGLALTAAISGVIAERRATARERTEQMLKALATEHRKNQEHWGGPFRRRAAHEVSHRLYPRLLTTTTETALSSGIFSSARYSDLHAALLEWQDAAGELNRRFDLAEIRSYVGRIPHSELLTWEEALHADDGPLKPAETALARIRELLDRAERD